MWAFGFLFEVVADQQKSVWRRRPENAAKDRWIATGLWGVCRHPNYFGEITMWVAMAISVSAAGLTRGDVSSTLAWVSPAFTTVLLLKVSGIPMLQRSAEKKWGHDPAFKHYQTNTNLLLPGRPAKPFPANSLKKD